MRRSALARPLAALALLAAPAGAATLTGEEIFGPYSWNEFVSVVSRGPLAVVSRGAPQGFEEAQFAREVLPAVQAARPHNAATFALSDATSGYRLVLVFDAGVNATAENICADLGRVARSTPSAGAVRVSLVYCRGAQPLTAAVGVASASGPTDPAVGQLFREALPIMFPPRNRLLEGGAQPLQ